MMEFLRSLFGLSGAGNKRQVVGVPKNISVKELPYVKESIRRLADLKDLCGRFQYTPYARQVEQVLVKTKQIHSYLVTRNRSQELELFHLQHTDHFINTFTVILNVHQQHHELSSDLPPVKQPRRVLKNPFKSNRKQDKAARVLNQQTSEQVLAATINLRTGVPRLPVPEIAINTYSHVVYLKEESPDVQSTHEIGYTSSPEEKAAFEAYVAEKLGVQDITYSGNAMVYIDDHQNSDAAELAPVIHWHGCPYILSLEEGRLHPVRTIRKQSETR